MNGPSFTGSMSECVHSTIYWNDRSGDVARKRGRKKGNEVADILRFTEVADGNVAFDEFAPRLFSRMKARKNLFAIDAAGRNAIHGNAFRGEIT